MTLRSINHQAKSRKRFLEILQQEVTRTWTAVDADPVQNGVKPQQTIHPSATKDYSSGQLLFVLHTDVVNILVLPWKFGFSLENKSQGSWKSLLKPFVYIQPKSILSIWDQKGKKLKRKHNLEPSYYSHVGNAVFKNIFTDPWVTCVFNQWLPLQMQKYFNHGKQNLPAPLQSSLSHPLLV